ncbi:unnamed protein product, partial [Didymodactylos carnosus]
MRITDDLKKYKVGCCLMTKSFLSSSVDRTVAETFAYQQNYVHSSASPHSRVQADENLVKFPAICTYSIRHKRTGLHIEDILQYPVEGEVLIMPHCVFKVQQITKTVTTVLPDNQSVDEIVLIECDHANHARIMLFSKLLNDINPDDQEKYAVEERRLHNVLTRELYEYCKEGIETVGQAVDRKVEQLKADDKNRLRYRKIMTEDGQDDFVKKHITEIKNLKKKELGLQEQIHKIQTKSGLKMPPASLNVMDIPIIASSTLPSYDEYVTRWDSIIAKTKLELTE